jgi:hypothetical protein
MRMNRLVALVLIIGCVAFMADVLSPLTPTPNANITAPAVLFGSFLSTLWVAYVLVLASQRRDIVSTSLLPSHARLAMLLYCTFRI